jgi:hypothetical protein
MLVEKETKESRFAIDFFLMFHMILLLSRRREYESKNPYLFSLLSHDFHLSPEGEFKTAAPKAMHCNMQIKRKQKKREDESHRWSIIIVEMHSESSTSSLPAIE